jgi:hypothetical protein
MRTRFLFMAFVFACVSLQAATVQIAGDQVNESNSLTSTIDSTDSTNPAQVAETPEPATFLMLGGGLLAVAALLRRMRKL